MDKGLNNEEGDKKDKMAPNINEIKTPEISDDFNEDEDEVDFVHLNDDIDNINSALDQMESRADDIIAQIHSLLQSNRELVKEVLEEKAMDDVEKDLKEADLNDKKEAEK